MRDTDVEVSNENILESLEGTVDMFIQSCETTFVDHPIILVDEELYKRVQMIMEKVNKYTNTFKGDLN